MTQDEKLKIFNEEVKKILEFSPCDNCGQIEGVEYSGNSLAILCQVCREMIQRICINRNKRIEVIEQLKKDIYG